MQHSRRLSLLSSACAIAGMVVSPSLPALAQQGPVSTVNDGIRLEPGPQANIGAGDPPARVGRVARIRGSVSFHTGDATQWDKAVANFPVTVGDAFWTEPAAQAEIDVAASRLVLDAQTELDLTTLNDRAVSATEPQGRIFAELRNLRADEAYVVQTPRATVTMAANGRYEIVAGDTDHPTTITVIEGAATVTGDNVSLQVLANQTGTVTGTETFQGAVGSTPRDEFLTAMLAADRPAVPVPRGVPRSVATMPGYGDLASNGEWRSSPQYGEVWYPRVERDWVPYRHGHWSFVAPWGWTWIDDAPWGFAPFHYGRWAQVDERWAWVPGEPQVIQPAPVEQQSVYAQPVYEQPVYAEPEPVYAPALVTFIDPGSAFVGGLAVGALIGHIGWCPLGPREPYYPPYRSSPNYIRELNVNNVTNVNTLTVNNTTNNISVTKYVNVNATTVTPAAALAQATPVATVAQKLPAAAVELARPVAGPVPVTPTATTPGVTPAVAKQLNLKPTLPGIAPVQTAAAPGPALSPQGTLPAFKQLNGQAIRPIVPAASGNPVAVPPGISPTPAPGIPPVVAPTVPATAGTPGISPGAAALGGAALGGAAAIGGTTLLRPRAPGDVPAGANTGLPLAPPAQPAARPPGTVVPPVTPAVVAPGPPPRPGLPPLLPPGARGPASGATTVQPGGAPGPAIVRPPLAGGPSGSDLPLQPVSPTTGRPALPAVTTPTTRPFLPGVNTPQIEHPTVPSSALPTVRGPIGTQSAPTPFGAARPATPSPQSLAPVTPQPLSPAAPRPFTPSPQPLAPVTPQPFAPTAPRPLAPVAPQLRPAPVTTPQFTAPPPRPSAPVVQAQPQLTPPPAPRFAPPPPPPPHFAAPAAPPPPPQPRFTPPPPQPRFVAPPPQPHFTPPPAPPPQPRFVAPPPQPHFAPPPPPPPRPAPPPPPPPRAAPPPPPPPPPRPAPTGKNPLLR